MSKSNHLLVRDFFVAIAKGELPDTLVTPDLAVWTLTGGNTDGARFQGGVKMLASLFGGTLEYSVDAITAEEDRAVAEVRSHGTLVNGEHYENTQVFTFRVREGRIAAVREYMNPIVVREKIVPLLQAAANRPST